MAISRCKFYPVQCCSSEFLQSSLQLHSLSSKVLQSKSECFYENFAANFRVPQRYLLLFSLTMFLLLYFLTYPYPIVSSTIPEYNGQFERLLPRKTTSQSSATTKGGCNTAEYSWCEGAGTTSPWLFLPIIIGIMGIAFPLAMIALDTIYSKVLGKINQVHFWTIEQFFTWNFLHQKHKWEFSMEFWYLVLPTKIKYLQSVMQGAFIVADDVMQVCGPVYTT